MKMAKTQTRGATATDGGELVSEARALAFCAQLTQNECRIVAMAIDRRIVESGYPSGVRAGNPAWMRARLAQVSELIRRDADLSEVGEGLSQLEELRNGDDGPTRQMAKDALVRIKAGAALLREEAGASDDFEDDAEDDE